QGFNPGSEDFSVELRRDGNAIRLHDRKHTKSTPSWHANGYHPLILNCPILTNRTVGGVSIPCKARARIPGLTTCEIDKVAVSKCIKLVRQQSESAGTAGLNSFGAMATGVEDENGRYCHRRACRTQD